MFKTPFFTIRPTETQIRKYHVKFAKSLTLPFKAGTTTPKVSHTRLLKRFKGSFQSKLRYETKSDIMLSLVKTLARSIIDVQPLSSYAKRVKTLEYYRLDTKSFSGWKNLMYVSKSIKALVIYENPLRGSKKLKSLKKNDNINTIKAHNRSIKENLLRYCMNCSFKNLRHINLILRIDEEQSRYLLIFEKLMFHLQALQDIDMTIISFIGKMSISIRSFPNIFSKIRTLKVYTQKDIQQLDEIFIEPKLLINLKELCITGGDGCQGNWSLFRCIEKLKHLQKLEIWLTNPNSNLCQTLLSSISLPEELESFCFGLSTISSEVCEALFEDYNWEDYSIFECPKQFKRFVAALHSCLKLKELRVEIDNTRFIKHFNNLFINLCEKLHTLKQLCILIREPQRDFEDFNPEGVFRLDLILQNNPRLLNNVISFELTVPALSLRNLPENPRLTNEELNYLKLSGKLFEKQDNYKLSSFLGNLRCKKDFKIVLSDHEVDDEDILRKTLEILVNIPKIRSFVYMFDTTLDKTIVLSVIKEFIGAKVAGVIKFSAMSGLSTAYIRKFKEFLRKNNIEGTIQNHIESIIIRWKPADSV